MSALLQGHIITCHAYLEIGNIFDSLLKVATLEVNMEIQSLSVLKTVVDEKVSLQMSEPNTYQAK